MRKNSPLSRSFGSIFLLFVYLWAQVFSRGIESINSIYSLCGRAKFTRNHLEKHIKGDKKNHWNAVHCSTISASAKMNDPQVDHRHVVREWRFFMLKFQREKFHNRIHQEIRSHAAHTNWAINLSPSTEWSLITWGLLVTWIPAFCFKLSPIYYT